MHRRSALVTIGLATLSGAASFAKPLRLLQPRPLHPGVAGADPQLTIEERLRRDLARLKPKAYSEEGIPMFLACVDLVPRKASPKTTLTATNTDLSSELRRDAEAFKHIQPDAQAKDVAPIIEMLADRDFAEGRIVEGA